MKITALYAAPLAFLFMAMMVNVIRLRYKHRVSLGSNDIPELERAIRAHGNFAEHVPLTLMLIGISEFLGAAAPLVHLFGASLLTARLSHAYCLCLDYKPILRQFGVSVTFLGLATSALTAFILAF